MRHGSGREALFRTEAHLFPAPRFLRRYDRSAGCAAWVTVEGRGRFTPSGHSAARYVDCRVFAAEPRYFPACRGCTW